MKEEIKQLINSIYIDHRTELFTRGCSKPIGFLDDLIHSIDSFVDKITRCESENEPAERIYISINEKEIGDIHIRYESVLNICKIAKYYYLQHEFSIDNPDDERIDPVLDGFRDEAYTKRQFKMDEMIARYMNTEGYERLSYYEMEESFSKPVYMKDYGKEEYLTVNAALFMDYVGINEN